MKSLIERAINLAKITNDNVIVADEKNEKGYVIMPLEKYEELVNEKGIKSFKKLLTEEEKIDKINRDIVFSEKEKDFDNLEEENFDNLECIMDENLDDEEIEEDNMYYYNDSNENNNTENNLSFNNDAKDDSETYEAWKIPSSIKRKAEEINI